MQRRNSATPCPVVGLNQFKFGLDDSLLSVSEDTATIEFAREFQASLRLTKPRRQQTAVRHLGESVSSFAIHEDEVQHGTVQHQAVAKRNGFGASSLAQ